MDSGNLNFGLDVFYLEVRDLSVFRTSQGGK